MTTDDKNLLKEKHKFICAVFDEKLQTNRGKKYVREYEGCYNAQSLCQKLNSFCNESTNASVRASTELSYITSAKIES